MNRIRKGDTVEVISGNERQQRGVVHEIWPKKDRLIISGINIITKHQRATPTGGQTPAQAGRIEREAPVHLSNVALVCPHCDEATRVGFHVLPDGFKVRKCKKCGRDID